MARQTESADPLHPLCDLKEVPGLAPSALNRVHQTRGAGTAPAPKERRPGDLEGGGP